MMKKKHAYLILTLVGTAISFYGNSKVQKAVREEKLSAMQPKVGVKP